MLGRSSQKPISAGILLPFLIAGILSCLSGLAPGSTATAGRPTGIAPNHGQLPAEVLFHTPTGTGNLFFTNRKIVLDQPEAGQATWIWIEGASESTRLVPSGMQTTKLNYCKGSDPEQWVTQVPLFDEVVYEEVEPGVDLWIRPEGDCLRYALRNASGVAQSTADLFRFEGIDILDEPDSARPGEGVLRWSQSSTTENGYDRADNPSSLTYSSFIGGWGHDRAHALEVLDSGRIVVGGYSESPNFPVTPGSYEPVHQGDYDACVCLFDADYSTLLWATFIGGLHEDRVFGIHEDDHGDLIFCGHTYSVNFPTTPGAFDRTFGTPRDAYCAKLDPTGSMLLFSTYIGGSSTDRAWDLGLDTQGRPILCGETYSFDFPTTPGAYDPDRNGESFSDAFLVKLESDGSDLVWGTYFGGTETDYNKYMSVFPDDSPVVIGGAISEDFPTTAGVFDETHNGGVDTFVAKFTPDGSALIYSTLVGGISSDEGEVVAIAPFGEVVVTGATRSENFPIAGNAWDPTHNGNKDAFVFRLDAAGENLVFSTFVGGSEDDEPWSLVLGQNSEPIFSSYINSPDFPTTPNAFDLTHNGGTQDANLTMLDATGSSLIYSSFLGGNSLDGGWELDLDGSGLPVLVGPTGSADFPTTPDAYDSTHNGGRDMFVARFFIGEPSSTPVESDANDTGNRLRVGPNPFVHETEIQLDLAGSTNARLVVIDAAGREVARLGGESIVSGTGAGASVRVSWDGTDSRGRALPSGTYWLRAISDQGSLQRAMTILR